MDDVVRVRPAEATAAGVNRELCLAVRDAISAGDCPVVLAGNCNAALGILAGMDGARAGIVFRGLMKIRVTTQPDWSKVGEHAHLVQFYEDESVLIPRLGRYVGTARILSVRL